MKRLTGKQVADALGWYYHDKPKESRRVMCDAAAETLNALANACSYESAHRLLRESRDFLEAAEFKESENAIAAQDVRDRIAIELGEWNADHEPNKSEGAATREGAGAAMRGPPSDPPTAWTEEQIGAAERIGDAYWRLERGTDTRAAFCAEIARVARIFVDPRGENTGDVTVGLSPERETRPTSTRQQSPRAPAPSGEAAARECSVASPVSPPAPQSPRWTEEQRQAATSIAATVAFWKERADDREIALTCAEIAKHAHLFCALGHFDASVPTIALPMSEYETMCQQIALLRRAPSALPSREITKPFTEKDASREMSRDDVHRLCVETANLLRHPRTPTRDERDNLATRLEWVPRLNRSDKRAISAAEFRKFVRAYFDHHGNRLESLRAAFAAIGIEVKT